MLKFRYFILVVVILGLGQSVATAQGKDNREEHSYPKSIRGYKIEHARIVVSKQTDVKTRGEVSPDPSTADAYVSLGDPKVVRITPLGITFEIPVVLSGLKEGGHVDFLSFKDVVVNGTPVEVEDYTNQFDLPNEGRFDLPSPVRVYLSTPHAVIGAIDEWSDSKLVWNVSATVFVFGRFRKFLMKFKRAIPVEVQADIKNPLRRDD
jgi:hypothetical protein